MKLLKFILPIMCAFALILAFFPLQVLAVDDGVLYGTYTLADSLDLSSFSTKKTAYNFSSGITVDGTTYTYVIFTSTSVGFGKTASLVLLSVYSSGAWTDESYKDWTFSSAVTPSSDFLTWFSANLATSSEEEDTDTSSPSFDESLIDPDNFNVIYYEDYIVETYFDGTSDVAVVTFPTELVHTYAFSSDGVLLEEHVGSYSSTFTQADTRLLISLLGTEFAIDATDGYAYYSLYPTGNNVVSLAEFPEGTTATFDIDIASGGFYYGSSYLYDYALADDFTPYFASIGKASYTKYDDYFNLNCDIQLTGSSEAIYGAYGISLEEFNLGDYTLTVNSITVTFPVDGLLSWYEETGKTNELLEDILAKLDEIQNGDHGFDASDSDFSDDAEDLSSSMDQIDEVTSSGLALLTGMIGSNDFTSTLVTLSACFDAVFVGHEVTICGVTANPFSAASSIAALVIIFSFLLKLIFRKWGSGGKSSGGSSDSSGGGAGD